MAFCVRVRYGDPGIRLLVAISGNMYCISIFETKFPIRVIMLNMRHDLCRMFSRSVND